jgi:inorganic triphosphatase YgiF
LSVRDEWEVGVKKPAPDFSVFGDAGLTAFFEDITGGRSLVVLFEVRVERSVLNLLLPEGAAVELAADTGEIICRDLRAPICEVELELKKGKPESLTPLIAALKKKFPLKPGELSKFARGMELLEKQKELPLVTASQVFTDRFGC